MVRFRSASVATVSLIVRDEDGGRCPAPASAAACSAHDSPMLERFSGASLWNAKVTHTEAEAAADSAASPDRAVTPAATASAGDPSPGSMKTTFTVETWIAAAVRSGSRRDDAEAFRAALARTGFPGIVAPAAHKLPPSRHAAVWFQRRAAWARSAAPALASRPTVASAPATIFNHSLRLLAILVTQRRAAE